jgi:HTH-type transcriptional regulator / antitoxin HigA
MTRVDGKMPAIAKYPRVITSKAQHEAYVSWLLELQRQKGLSRDDKDVVRLLILVIKDYESRQFPVEAASPREVLEELMEANNLRQKDLAPLLGGESVVSNVLSGHRELNKHQIERLSQQFNVSPAVFF